MGVSVVLEDKRASRTVLDAGPRLGAFTLEADPMSSRAFVSGNVWSDGRRASYRLTLEEVAGGRWAEGSVRLLETEPLDDSMRAQMADQVREVGTLALLWLSGERCPAA